MFKVATARRTYGRSHKRWQFCSTLLINTQTTVILATMLTKGIGGPNDKATARALYAKAAAADEAQARPPQTRKAWHTCAHHSLVSRIDAWQKAALFLLP